MVLLVLGVPVAFLLFALAMEWLEAVLLAPAKRTAPRRTRAHDDRRRERGPTSAAGDELSVRSESRRPSPEPGEVRSGGSGDDRPLTDLS